MGYMALNFSRRIIETRLRNADHRAARLEVGFAMDQHTLPARGTGINAGQPEREATRYFWRSLPRTRHFPP